MMQDPNGLVGGVDPRRIADMAVREADLFVARRPKTCRAARQSPPNGFLGGVPMLWMKDWPQPFPIVVDRAQDACLIDVDGNRLDDFCLGDTGSMFGHAPPALTRAITEQVTRGLTYMLPSVDADAVGRLLQERFGPFLWQIATTASDANRFSLRVARAVTGRPKVLVFAGSYHGAVDDTFVEANPEGRTVASAGLVGQAADLSEVATVVEFNDAGALEKALAQGDVAAVLTEPVMTNCCMVLPEPGFLDALRQLTRQFGTLFILDETHTLSSGLGGYARRQGLEPDILVIGKAVAGGVPAAVWGVASDVARRFAELYAGRPAGFSGIGTTLAASPLQIAALKATLSAVMTSDAYSAMESGAARLERGLRTVVEKYGAPWHVVRAGARVEFICHPGPLKNGSEGRAAHKPSLERALHLALANHGCLIAPFHNMMLVSPVTKHDQIDRLIAAFEAICGELFA